VNQTIRHGLPLLTAGQAQKEISHNEALMAIDRRLHPVVESRGCTSPPDQVAAGSAFIIPADATGAWASSCDSIASYDGLGWDVATPARGTLVWIADEQGFSVFDGTWSTDGFPRPAPNTNGRLVFGADLIAIADPAGGGLIDVECRTAIGVLLASLRAQGIIL
jgi:hypothetical protein